jgi:hypothetical protein
MLSILLEEERGDKFMTSWRVLVVKAQGPLRRISTTTTIMAMTTMPHNPDRRYRMTPLRLVRRRLIALGCAESLCTTSVSARHRQSPYPLISFTEALRFIERNVDRLGIISRPVGRSSYFRACKPI